MITIELIAGPWDGHTIERQGIPPAIYGTTGGMRWEYAFTGRHNADGHQLWALTSTTPAGADQ